jgi:hypothetical protein
MLLYAVNGDGILLYVLYCRPTVPYVLYCAVLYSTLNIFTGIHTDKICAIHLDKGFMATRDGTCFAPGFWTGNGREKREKR